MRLIKIYRLVKKRLIYSMCKQRIEVLPHSVGNLYRVIPLNLYRTRNKVSIAGIFLNQELGYLSSFFDNYFNNS